MGTMGLLHGKSHHNTIQRHQTKQKPRRSTTPHRRQNQIQHPQSRLHSTRKKPNQILRKKQPNAKLPKLQKQKNMMPTIHLPIRTSPRLFQRTQKTTQYNHHQLQSILPTNP